MKTKAIHKKMEKDLHNYRSKLMNQYNSMNLQQHRNKIYVKKQ